LQLHTPRTGILTRRENRRANLCKLLTDSAQKVGAQTKDAMPADGIRAAHLCV